MQQPGCDGHTQRAVSCSLIAPANMYMHDHDHDVSHAVVLGRVAACPSLLCCAADQNTLKLPDSVQDLDAVLLTDILPTAWHAPEMGEVGPGDVVAIWGAGPGETLGWVGKLESDQHMLTVSSRHLAVVVVAVNPACAGKRQGGTEGNGEEL